ncbi:MAG TPA: divalent-cation tolerance protein CutA [Candidatus Acidoferrum sp.]|nr:divalent-cation tolerance protein CutA [Candidatus Acidoferrum sp.]
MARKTGARIVLVTCGSREEARRVARFAVQARLAACVNLVSAPLESIYRWKGKVETAKEFLLVMKSSKGKLARLEREVKRIHSYELPEFLVLEITGGSEAYLKWLLGAV